MSADAFKHKQPFSPDADTREQLQPWHTPDVTVPPEQFRTNALNLTAASARHTDVAVDEAIAIKPLTADDIEQIRQAAFDEGITQGKEEGFSQGYQEGREQGQQDGFNQGLADGRKQGFMEGQDELQQQLAALTQLLHSLQQPLASLNSDVEQSLVDLALVMAKAVLAVEVKTNRAVILQAVQQATAALPMQTEHMLIKLHPADLAVIEQHFTPQQLKEQGWQLRSDPLLEQGGCLVETDTSRVDRTITQRLTGALEYFIQQEQQPHTINTQLADRPSETAQASATTTHQTSAEQAGADDD
ncbi:flagellar assembly protein FliH [Arsukibacterium sp.]|uniref:flagellar assembly protein FliH n=1 Tax=Arsukibacterium sp. TaxID=1977258 RepID=UPI002FDADC4E